MTQRHQYEVRLSSHAERDLDDLPLNDFRRVDARIQSLADNPRPPGVAKLWNDSYRVRIGSWRIIYIVDDTNRIVVVDTVRRREKDTYR